ncbi:MAG: hypothetical protein QG635_591 [Bacteroidota bacterium]|nr:hypothetical protein [Bacteroidota bacterium]
MEQYTVNGHSEMLTLLLDGELPETQEISLYSALAGSEDLRSEMKELLAIKESIRRDTEAFTPSGEASAAVFQRLGFNSSAIKPAAEISKPAAALWSSLIRKYSTPVISAIAASLLTFVAVSHYYESNIDSVSEKNIPVVSSVENPSSQIEKSGNNAASSGFVSEQSAINAHNFNNSADKNIISHRNISASKNNNKAEESLPADNYINNTNNAAIEPNVDIADNTENNTGITQEVSRLTGYNPEIRIGTDNLMQIRTQPEAKMIDYPVIRQNSSAPVVKSKIGLVMQLRGTMFGKSFPESNSPDEASSFMSNKGLGLYIPVGSGFQFGIEGGMEPFAQVYLNNENNKDVNYNLNNTVAWFGITGRYEAKEIAMFNIAYPYFQLMVGSAETGFLTKFGLGYQFDIYGPFVFALGAEYGMLLYENQNTWYSTNKLGANAGLLIRF